MGGSLYYFPVMAMFSVIIVCTIFLEQLVKRTKSWLLYFNPLLMPVVDKIMSELMILGAMAFTILLVNDTNG
jgi:hypothetical protein